MTKKQYLSELTDEQKAAQIPVYLHDREMARAEHDKKCWQRAFFAALLIIVLMIVGFFIYETQYMTYQIDQDIDTQDGTSVVSGVGGITYGEDTSKNKNPGQENQQPEPDETMPEM